MEMEVPIEIYERALGGHHSAVAEYLAYQHQNNYVYDLRVKKWYRRKDDGWTEDTLLSIRTAMIRSFELLIQDIDQTLDNPNGGHLIDASLRKNRKSLNDLIVKLKMRPYWDSVAKELKLLLRGEILSEIQIKRDKEINKIYREKKAKELRSTRNNWSDE